RLIRGLNRLQIFERECTPRRTFENSQEEYWEGNRENNSRWVRQFRASAPYAFSRLVAVSDGMPEVSMPAIPPAQEPRQHRAIRRAIKSATSSEFVTRRP
ncbi:hypothetical protein K0M31_010558, partial [Melipona bicolor]